MRDDARAILAKIENGEKVDHHDTVRLTKDGQRIDVSLGVSPVRSHSGVIVGAAKVARDISARIKSQEALRESEQTARDIIAGALDGFIQIKETGEVVEWNPQAEVIFGWSREQALGKRLTDLFLPPDYQLRHREMRARLQSRDAGANVGERFDIDAGARMGEGSKSKRH